MITRSSSGGPSGPAANEDAGRPAGAWRTAHAARPLALPRHRTKGWVWSVQWIRLELEVDWTGLDPSLSLAFAVTRIKKNAGSSSPCVNVQFRGVPLDGRSVNC